ncbi:hypothetical protein [Chromobacterium haemolyticum]|uniref:hypothetical protein n=1 Tax=Chromobacterium haemolyticum TaxID=394935 RepID=UPI00244CA0B5|nr:hypothetical protein [Chromobacterium haemolyticum]MDH0342006.1 hypothetical protein [Chromobacterium haemolyticum]
MIDATSMLGTFLLSFPGFENLLNVLVAFLGVLLTGLAVLKFIEIGRFGAQPGGVRWITPVMYLMAGAALWNFASSVDSFLESFYGSSTSVHNLLSYTSSSRMPEQTKLLLTALIATLRLYGYFTYVRGWLSVRRIGSGQNGSDEVFKAAMIRLAAGVGLINIVGTVNAASSTFGFGNVL